MLRTPKGFRAGTAATAGVALALVVLVVEAGVAFVRADARVAFGRPDMVGVQNQLEQTRYSDDVS